MSDNLNQELRANTLLFVSSKFMTAAGIAGLEAGSAPFNLHKHTIDGNVVARLAPWNANAGELPLLGYWVPQGGSCLVPVDPGARIFVFTPDFSGCHIRVDQIDAGNYRVYHVQGGGNYMQTEYQQGPHDHGLGLAGQLDFDDYGTAQLPRAFAFLKFENTEWKIYYQSQNGVGLGFAEGVLRAIGQQTVRGGGIKDVAKLNV
tara:strand:+ start:6020 stop:6628 length:609 start_codon:yes stop_codon:yes gene_type:complete